MNKGHVSDAIDEARVASGFYPTEEELYGPGGICEQIRSTWTPKEHARRAAGPGRIPADTAEVSTELLQGTRHFDRVSA